MEDKENRLNPIPLAQLRKVTDKLSELPDDTPISLEFVLTALFPSVWENIQQYSNDCYTAGYIQGRNESKNEN